MRKIKKEILSLRLEKKKSNKNTEIKEVLQKRLIPTCTVIHATSSKKDANNTRNVNSWNQEYACTCF